MAIAQPCLYADLNRFTERLSHVTPTYSPAQTGDPFRLAHDALAQKIGDRLGTVARPGLPQYRADVALDRGLAQTHFLGNLPIRGPLRHLHDDFQLATGETGQVAAIG